MGAELGYCRAPVEITAEITHEPNDPGGEVELKKFPTACSECGNSFANERMREQLREAVFDNCTFPEEARDGTVSGS